MYSVQTQVLTVDPYHPEPALIARAAEVLRAGELVSFPTETVYGLGANALDPAAVDRIFEVKQRPSYDPVIVHIASLAQLAEVARDVPALAYALAEEFWPGPLTLVLKKHPAVAPNVSTGLDTVAVRMPNHRIPLALVETSGLPVAAPSANLFTRPSPTSARHVLEDLNGRVDILLDGGACPIGLESTVLDLTAATPTILRPGGLATEVLQARLTALESAERYVTMEGEQPLAAPGMLAKHYSPKAKLLLFTGGGAEALPRLREIASALAARGLKVGLMTTLEDAPAFDNLPVELAPLGSEHNLPEIAHNLFDRIRHLDSLKVDVILVRALPRTGLGLAIWDRLLRAAELRVLDLDGEVDVDG